ncbi:MAG: hypothetical protein JST87_03895 [Bacteroidetes bacterium]|nr:hypothetical protein [Bacteroidota bacterium]
MMKIKKNRLILFVFALIGFGFYGVHEYFRSNKDVSGLKENFRMRADDMIQAFATNETVAEKKFIGKIIVVQGKLKEVEKDEKGYYTLVLGDTGTASSVRCLIDTLHTNDIKAMQKGDSVVLKGMLVGYNADATGLLGSDIQLNRCMRMNEK